MGVIIYETEQTLSSLNGRSMVAVFPESAISLFSLIVFLTCSAYYISVYFHISTDKKSFFYLAAMGPSSWEIAFRTADGVSTIWNPMAIENRKKTLGNNSFPTAAQIPFSLSSDNFMGRNIKTVDDLKKQVDAMETAGFDEVIIAYRDMKDLKAVAQLIERK